MKEAERTRKHDFLRSWKWRQYKWRQYNLTIFTSLFKILKRTNVVEENEWYCWSAKLALLTTFLLALHGNCNLKRTNLLYLFCSWILRNITKITTSTGCRC